LILATTIGIIIITIFIGGGLTTTVMKMLKIKTGVDHTLSAKDLTKKTLSIEKKFAYPFLLRTGYRHRVSSSKSSGGGFDFDSPSNQTLRSTGLFDGTQNIVKNSPHYDQDYEDDSDSSLYSEVEISPTRENTFSVEKRILNKVSLDNMNLAENKNHSMDIEDVEINDPFLDEPSRSHKSKNSSMSNFYCKIVNDT
jgi:NhaP-type Na+/H+ or K+/H+ antiporter